MCPRFAICVSQINALANQFGRDLRPDVVVIHILEDIATSSDCTAITSPSVKLPSEAGADAHRVSEETREQRGRIGMKKAFLYACGCAPYCETRRSQAASDCELTQSVIA